MTGESDETNDSIRRALEAAEAANDAANDLAQLSAAHKAFAAAVIKSQRRNTAIASGAALGTVVALGLAGLVYFRSVADLREASEVQATAAELLVEQITRFEELLPLVEEKQHELIVALADSTQKITDEMAKQARENKPMDAQIATTITESVHGELAKMQEELTNMLAELDLKGGSGGAASPELLAKIDALLAALDKAPAQPQAAASHAAPAAPTTHSRPRNRSTAPAEPNPFTYP